MASLSSPRKGVHALPTLSTSASSLDLQTPKDISGDSSHRPSEVLDIWPRAYKILQDREPELVEDYKKHLASLQGDRNSKHLSVETTVSRLMHDFEKNQWRVSLLDKDIIIRQHVERLTKFLFRSDSLVQAAVSSQPYAALAWSGAFLFLSLLTSATSMNASMLKGFNSLCDVQVYWEIVEKQSRD
ncbi:hypothetical protein VTN31DRAFT_2936 [Thermomyces dupontii]|uniref:uncharacterized protein n=1 Tax=Talaromyces thermophilus TaxID=28565 RepID=UPI003744190D